MSSSKPSAKVGYSVLVGLSLLLLVPVTCLSQEGYSLEPGRVVVNTRQHWEHWQSVPTTISNVDDGVRPAFIRKSTTLLIDGSETVVSGTNAVLDADAFGGGIRDAGSNIAAAEALMDGRIDTYWEPDADDLLEDWWVQIDLGRTVSATRIVLKFVDEETGDPFRQFRLTTSQGEVTVGPMLFRTRFTTSKPLVNERVIDIDLDKQTPTKWPNTRGDFTGDVIRFVGIGITDSGFGRAREVSQSEYEDLPGAQQGDIDYYRIESTGRTRRLDGKQDWDALDGSERQGPVIYHRRERPRLAEVEVWTIGDNIGTDVLARGGSVSSWENNGAESSVVDGDFFGEVVYWPAQGGFNPDRLLPSDPPDVERSMFIDLGGAFFLDNIRVLQAATQPPGPFRSYRIQLSDGSTNAGGSLAWETAGTMENIISGEVYHDFKFPLTKVKHFAFTYRLIERAGRHGLSEVQFFGEGYMPESRVASVFGGDSPFIELGPTAQNLSTIEWLADRPPGTELVLQTRTGNTVKAITHFYKKNGEEYPGTEEEAQAAYESDRKFFGANAVGQFVREVIPGADWSGWSQPYEHSGEKITSPSPRRYVAVQATFLTSDPTVAATLNSIALNFVTPVADRVVGEVLPSRLENIGQTQLFTYLVRSDFEPNSRGIDEILVLAPDGLELSLKQVNLEVTGQPAITYRAEDEALAILAQQSDSMWVRLPTPIKVPGGSALIQLQFEATVFGFNTFFTGAVGHSDFPGSWQRADDGDANGIIDSETTVVLALERGGVLGNVELEASFTPNGDGINDELEVSFSLLRVGAPVDTRIDIFDLSGRLVRTLLDGQLTPARHALRWQGDDRSGNVVPPGIYLLRIDSDVDSKSSRSTTIQRLVHVVY
jgi:hypothetical protein